MKVTPQEKSLLRELAKQYAELAALPIQKERYLRARDINDLKPRRPMVWLDEIPWHEMNINNELTLVCQDEAARHMEIFFRRTLYRWKHIQGDMVVEKTFNIPKSFTSTGMGVEVREHVLSNDDKNHIISHSYLDQLADMETVEALHMPVLTAHPETDKQRLAWANDILEGILPVRLQGYSVYHAPWDRIPRYRGVTQVLEDLAYEPEFTHAIIKKFTDGAQATFTQMENLGLFESDVSHLHCTPPYVSDFGTGAGHLTTEQPEPAPMKKVWFRAMAQLFTEVSPRMFEEFELDYVKPLMAQFGLVYYGCCEALDNKIQLLKTIPNLRKIGVSPWANAEVCAEQIGGNYVFAHKPNPAHVSGTFDEDATRKEITRIIKTCQANGCPYEFVIKDISTVTYKPQNLMDWAATVKDVINNYY
ncbi:MAG: hypothetical protein FWC73_06020 [Defluviitaleaceae bacterium]|nr:hypothetical protein [Defluviitaleaceae bacterium]